MDIESVVDKLFPVEDVVKQSVTGRLSSGYKPLDYALSGSFNEGGFPVGRVSMVYGAESTGKTLIATMACIANQKRGGLCIWMDFEHSFAFDFAQKFGLSNNPKLWRYSSPDTGEDGFETIRALTDELNKGNFLNANILIVIDSLASIVTLEEDNIKHVSDANMRTQLALASFTSKNFKWLHRNINKTNTTVLVLNQTRSNPNPFAGDESVPGGKAIKFYSSVILKLVKKGKVKEGEEVIGEEVEAETIKNKTYNPFLKCRWTTDFNTGVNIGLSTVDYLISKKLLDYSGGWVMIEGKRYRRKELGDLYNDGSEMKIYLDNLFNNKVLQ